MRFIAAPINIAIVFLKTVNGKKKMSYFIADNVDVGPLFKPDGGKRQPCSTPPSMWRRWANIIIALCDIVDRPDSNNWIIDTRTQTRIINSSLLYNNIVRRRGRCYSIRYRFTRFYYYNKISPNCKNNNRN